MLPLGLFRLLKLCKVKRFLATEDLSVVGLVTGSSGSNGAKWVAGEEEKSGEAVKSQKKPQRGGKKERANAWRQEESRLEGVYSAALSTDLDKTIIG